MTKSKKILTKVLNKPPKGCDKRLIGCATTWDAIITGTNIEFGEECNFPDQMPDFSKIKFDKNKLNGRSYGKE